MQSRKTSLKRFEGKRSNTSSKRSTTSPLQDMLLRFQIILSNYIPCICNIYALRPIFRWQIHINPDMGPVELGEPLFVQVVVVVVVMYVCGFSKVQFCLNHKHQSWLVMQNSSNPPHQPLYIVPSHLTTKHHIYIYILLVVDLNIQSKWQMSVCVFFPFL